MKKRFVISNLPIKLPFQSTILYAFLLHYFNANGVIWGVFITLYSIFWIGVIMAKWNEVKIDLNDEPTKENPPLPSFKERVAAKLAEQKSH